MSHLPHLPAEFVAAMSALRRAQTRPELKLSEVPAPARLAPYGVALGTEIMDGDEELAAGRFILLHDPHGSELWGGTFRVVTYIRAQLEPDIGNDSLLGNVAWAWLVESLEAQGARYDNAGGTATRILSESYGALAARADAIDIELRASWTPEDRDFAAHLEAWSNVVCTFAGLPPVPDGVTLLPRRRRNHKS